MIKDAIPDEFRSRIKGKVAVAGIGNIMRGDDGLGSKFIEMLKDRTVKASLFDCGTVPENYIIPILSTSCDTVILIDAAEMGLEPGSIKFFDLNAIKNVSFSTHNPSPRLFTDLLRTGKEDLNIFVVSIQPKTTDLGEGLSEEILLSLDILANGLLSIL